MCMMVISTDAQLQGHTWRACRATGWCQTGSEWLAFAIALCPSLRCRLPGCDPAMPSDRVHPHSASCWTQHFLMSTVLSLPFLISLVRTIIVKWQYVNKTDLLLTGFILFVLLFMNEVMNQAQYSGNILTTAQETWGTVITVHIKCTIMYWSEWS